MDEVNTTLRNLLATHRELLAELEQQKAELGPTALGRAAITLQIKNKREEIERIEQMLVNLKPSTTSASMDATAKLRDELGRWQSVITLEMLDRTELKLAPLEGHMARMQESIDRLIERITELENNIAGIEKEIQNRREKSISQQVLITGAIIFWLSLIIAIFFAVRLMT